MFRYLQFGRSTVKGNSSLALMTDGFWEILGRDMTLLNHPDRLKYGASAEDDWSAAWLFATPYPSGSRDWLVLPEETPALFPLHPPVS